MSLPLSKRYRPMEAMPAPCCLTGPIGNMSQNGMGFAVLRFAIGTRIDLLSKAGKPLTRYFPDLVDALAAISLQRSLCSMAKL